jgi:hypothetical protein
MRGNQTRNTQLMHSADGSCTPVWFVHSLHTEASRISTFIQTTRQNLGNLSGKGEDDLHSACLRLQVELHIGFPHLHVRNLLFLLHTFFHHCHIRSFMPPSSFSQPSASSWLRQSVYSLHLTYDVSGYKSSLLACHVLRRLRTRPT